MGAPDADVESSHSRPCHAQYTKRIVLQLFLFFFPYIISPLPYYISFLPLYCIPLADRVVKLVSGCGRNLPTPLQSVLGDTIGKRELPI